MASDTPPQIAPAVSDNAATAVKDQDINPWSVEGAQDQDGQVVAIDYVSLSK